MAKTNTKHYNTWDALEIGIAPAIILYDLQELLAGATPSVERDGKQWHEVYDTYYICAFPEFPAYQLNDIFDKLVKAKKIECIRLTTDDRMNSRLVRLTK